MIDFQKIAESGPFVVIKWRNSVGWPVEYVSENIVSLTGYDSNDFVSERVNYFDLVDVKDVSNFDEQLRSAEQDMLEEVRIGKYSITDKNKGTIWVETYVTILRNEAGNSTGYVGYLLNISDRVKTEIELEKSRNETRALINALPDTILQITKNGELKKYLTQEDSGGLENKSEIYVNDIFPSDFASNVIEYLNKVIEEKTINIYEYKNKLLDKKEHYFEARFSEKSTEDALIIIRDITERKENDEILQQAIRDVEKANEAKSTFLSSMSHELRTPLNAIIGFSQILIMDVDDERKIDKENINEILNAGKHLLSLINGILDIARIESGKIEIKIEPIPLADIIKTCESIVSPLTKKENITIEYVKSAADVTVMADKVRLNQVLLNLLSNAIKYNKTDGQVKLNFEVIEEKIIKIEVEDTGIGLSAQQIDLLFKPFERVGAEVTEIEGTGLGLALVKDMIELMGGEVGVKSVVGEGSIFWFTLNLYMDA